MARTPIADPAPPPFRGFGPDALTFLNGLAKNQSRDWFLANKAVFDSDLRGPLGALIEALSFAFAAHDIPLTGDAKRSLFRMNRDIRFSKDKSPYKTNAGAVMTRDGMKDSNGLLYIQIGGEGGSFMAAGFYASDPKDLAALRHGIARAPERWLAIESDLTKANLSLSMADALTRLPRGFEDYAGSTVAEALKRRNLVVRKPIEADRLQQVELVDDIVEFTENAIPLLRYGWAALERSRVAA